MRKHLRLFKRGKMVISPKRMLQDIHVLLKKELFCHRGYGM